MGPENPPRRSKSDQEPLTIDLEANAAPADDTATDGPKVEHEAVVQAAEDARPVDAEEPVNTEEPVEAAAPVDEDARAEAAAAAFAEEPAATTYTEQPTAAAPPSYQRPSNAGPLAAGILGGLIALLAAGGLQYAGVLPALGPATDNSTIEQSLSADIESIKAQLAAAPSSQTADLGPLETRLAALEKTASEAGTGTAADVSGLEAQITNLTGEIASLKSALADAQQSTEAAKTELSTRIDAAEKKIDEPASDLQLARAIAVTALKTAIDRGGPFLAELDALKSIAATDPAVTGLAKDAAIGVAPRADLTRDFSATADAMLEATEHNDPNQGVFSRLMDSASSAIRVRPVGSVEGEGPEAVIARIEDKLVNGDLKSASLEWDALPEPAKTAGADFKTRLDQRIRVEGLIDAAVSGAVTANQG
ncbi:COG4223 family protein [Pararhizobium sp. O133]|uniref:COG4223 family protein n=1 Tax=Pararhizobium sp. O133 TaxID=3449278 RepID=UPI003F686A52